MKPLVDVHLTPDHLKEYLKADVAAGLAATPKELPPKWFYDQRGSDLFERITRLPEYYPTRRERSILEERADFVAHFTGADTVVELGSGASDKTRLLLDAFHKIGTLVRFVPFDVCEPALRRAATTLAGAYPDTEVHAVVGDFEHNLGDIPSGGRRLVVFLGGTIGNLAPAARAEFLASLSATMDEGDALLLGTDLVKSEHRLLAAYDDGDGLTAEFNRNVLRVINRELHANFAPERFGHVVRWDPEREWIEMWLRADEAEEVVIDDLAGLLVRFETAETMRTEISAKFRRSGVEEELGGANLALGRWWTDADGDFALSLSFRE
jgi:L-histidine N-alpha-methyltransferase